jgi:hypothetical protein
MIAAPRKRSEENVLPAQSLLFHLFDNGSFGGRRTVRCGKRVRFSSAFPISVTQRNRILISEDFDQSCMLPHRLFRPYSTKIAR